MKLSPESRRQVGDNYEQIIFRILQRFGWTVVNTNFEIDVPKEIRKQEKQGADGAFLYYDPTVKYDIGVHVESKKCKNLKYFKSQLLKWFETIDNAIYHLNTALFSYGFQALSKSSKVEVTEGLLSVWIDEEYDVEEFKQIVRDTMVSYLDNKKSDSLLSMIYVVENQKLLQLEAILSALSEIRGKYNLSRRVMFEYAELGPNDAPTTMMLLNDIIFVRAYTDDQSNNYHIISFNLTDFSLQQLEHFMSCFIHITGQHISLSQGVHGFIWDFSPSAPDKINYWRAMFKNSIESKFEIAENLVTIQGFNTDYVNLSE